MSGDLRARRTERAAQADFRTPLEDGNEHHIGDADPADEEGNRSQADDQRGRRALHRESSRQRIRWAADRDLLGILGVGGGAQDGVDRADLVGGRPDVDPGREPVEGERRLRDRPADERRLVDLGRERQRLEDADHREPASPDPDTRGFVEPVDPEVTRGAEPEDRGRIVCHRGVEKGPVQDPSIEGVEQGHVGRADADAAGFVTGDEVTAVHGSGQQGRRRDVLHRWDVADHQAGRCWQFRLATVELPPVLHRE